MVREILRAKSPSGVGQVEWDGEQVPRPRLEKIGVIPAGEVAEAALKLPQEEKGA
jgi:hypothetical protein